MKKQENMTVYTYRYIWKLKDEKEGKFNVKYLTGVTEEHKQFMGRIQQDESVVSCARIYVSEVNVSLTEQHEIVKKEKK